MVLSIQCFNSLGNPRASEENCFWEACKSMPNLQNQRCTSANLQTNLEVKHGVHTKGVPLNMDAVPGCTDTKREVPTYMLCIQEVYVRQCKAYVLAYGSWVLPTPCEQVFAGVLDVLDR